MKKEKKTSLPPSCCAVFSCPAVTPAMQVVVTVK